MRKYEVNDSYFDTWTHNSAYVLGFLMADGYVLGKAENSSGIGCQLVNKDIEVLEFIRSEISPSSPLRSPPSCKGKYTKLNICSKKLVASVAKFGLVPRKTYSWKKIDFDIPEIFIPDFVRGHFDGDGYVFHGKVAPRVGKLETKRILKSGLQHFSPDYLQQLKDLVGLNASIYHKKGKLGSWHEIQLGIKDSLKLRDFMYNGNFSLTRKREIFFKETTQYSEYFYT